MHAQESAKRAKDAALRLATLSTATKNSRSGGYRRCLDRAPGAYSRRRITIDVTHLSHALWWSVESLAKPLLDRLKLTEHKVLDMATGVRSVGLFA